MNHSVPTKAGVVLALAVLASLTSPGRAHAVDPPNCGGQNAEPRPVPYTCIMPQKEIDGTTWSGTVHADGTRVTVTYALDAPRSVQTPLRVVHHEGVSGAGGPDSERTATLPAGATTATVTVIDPCRDGQLDVKAVFTARGDARGRVAGPWIRNGEDCAPSTTSPGTTTPPSSSPGTSTGTVPTPTLGSTVSVGTLPATGSGDGDAIGWATILLGTGGIALLVRRGKNVIR